jgi:LmbE family N-acetylglucosaminyl deacetylase
MTISIFTLCATALGLAAGLALAARHSVRRRLRRPRLVLGVILAGAALLVPLDVHLASDGVDAGGRAVGALPVSVGLASITALSAMGLLVMKARIPQATALAPRRILVIGAHPDDLELGCGATVAKLVDSGHEVHAIVMTSGERGGDRGARPAEADDGGQFLGTASLLAPGFTDTKLGENQLEMVAAIEGAIDRLDPDTILTHSANDQHQDHLAVHLATLRAARSRSTILCFESPSATPAFQPSFFVDIDGYLDVKTTAVGLHRDQRGKPYMTAERVRGLAIYRGGQAKVRHAEGFEPVRLLGSPLGVW